MSLSKDLLIVVFMFNFFKFVCFNVALRVCTSPLITIGDAIAYFLTAPDTTTAGLSTLPTHAIRWQKAWKNARHKDNYKSEAGPPVAIRWKAPRRRQWFEAASPRRWAVATIMFVSPAYVPQSSG